MKLFHLLLVMSVAAAADPPGPAIPHFTNVREVKISQPDRQNYFVIDPEIWAHSRADLADLRLYSGESPVQYALFEQNAGVSSDQVEVKVLNLGSVSGHTEFDLDTEGLPQYDRIRLHLDAHDFVVTARVSGGNSPGHAKDVQLTPSTLYDFSKEQLGSNVQLKIPASSFRYLHISLSPGVRPEQIKGAAIYNVHQQKASYTRAGNCSASSQEQRSTVITCDVLPHVPLNRISFQIDPSQVNFRRAVTIEDAKGVQFAAGEISRVRINRAGTLVTDEDLALPIGSADSTPIKIVINNGENPPLAITAVEPLCLERRVYFDPAGNSSLRLYYGDDKLTAPGYDYARFFHQEPGAVQAALAPGTHNPKYEPRPDDRPWSERHVALLWVAMIMAVVALGAVALRGFRSTTK